jgi:hypothetical protein
MHERRHCFIRADACIGLMGGLALLTCASAYAKVRQLRIA